MRFILLLPIFVSSFVLAQPVVMKITNTRAHDIVLHCLSTEQDIRVNPGQRIEVALVNAKDWEVRYASGLAGIVAWNYQLQLNFEDETALSVIDCQLDEETRGWTKNTYAAKGGFVKFDGINAGLFASVFGSFLAGSNFFIATNEFTIPTEFDRAQFAELGLTSNILKLADSEILKKFVATVDKVLNPQEGS